MHIAKKLTILYIFDMYLMVHTASFTNNFYKIVMYLYVHTAKLNNCSYGYAWLILYINCRSICFQELAKYLHWCQNTNDEESSNSSSEVENFNLQKRDSTESSSAPSLPSSLENLHILSDDENNLTSCPTVSMKPASNVFLWILQLKILFTRSYLLHQLPL